MRLTIAPFMVGVNETKDDDTGEITSRMLVFTEHLVLANGMAGPPNIQVEIGPYDTENWEKLVAFVNNPTEEAAREEAASRIITPDGPLSPGGPL